MVLMRVIKSDSSVLKCGRCGAHAFLMPLRDEKGPVANVELGEPRRKSNS